MKKVLIFAFVLLLSTMFFAEFIVTMVTDTGGLGDQSFNDGTWSGVVAAEKELGITIKVVQSYEQADYVPNLSNAAKESKVVIAVGFMMEDALKQVAPQYPNTYFVGIDIGDLQIPNVKTYTFKEQESAFLAGFLAGAMTKTDIVGFIGGIPIPPVQRFEWGYRAGIKMWNRLFGKNVQVLIGYTQTFTDSQKGKTLTEAQYSQKADIVFAAAGLCGLGTFEAAKSYGAGYYAIGVDVDQDHLAPGKILTSAMKGINAASYFAVKDAFEGFFESGHEVLGLAEGGATLSAMKYTRDVIPAWVFVMLKGLETMAVTGEFTVPDSEEGVLGF
ncbi:MAG: BMP family ABC transporter substrate-binding protein [Euryarchaeota archaeon]|nr:BMP family ABC transporter substrate-binding protein [Euryarchaeota archaeon]